MTPQDKTDRTQTEALRFEFDLPHAPAKVWRALTEPELLAEWLLPVIGFEPKPGVAFRFKRDPLPGWDGTVDCRVLAADERRKLSYTWVVGDLETVVTFLLTPTDAGTQLVLVQSGFTPQQKQNFGGARYGWRQMGGRLEDLLATLEEPA
jgi:uncharacterized protein YndB with AHSA1/START domain